MVVLPLAGQGTAPRDAVTASPVSPQASSASSRLAGRVTAANDGSPLRRAVLAITVSGRIQSKVVTDDDGRFETAIPASGPYLVSVTKSGYLPVSLPRPAARTANVTLDLSLAKSAVISGRVTDAGGHAVVSVRVRIARTDTPGIRDVYGVTDDLGTFRVAGLATGTYSVTTIGSPEYLNVTDVAELKAGAPLADRQTSSEAVRVEATVATEYDVSLAYRDTAVILPDAPIGGVVAGQITDEAGEAAAGLTVELLRLTGIVGTAGGAMPPAPRVTDDRGRYRFFHVRPGRYALVVTDERMPTERGESSWLPVYYPGSASPSDVVSFQVERNQEISGIDMVFTPTRGARVFGLALNAAGRPVQVPVSLIAPTLEWPVATQMRTVTVDADGGFAFENIPPGEYALRAAPSRPGIAAVTFVSLGGQFPSAPSEPNRMPPEFAMQTLQLTDADAGPLLLRTAAPATLRGRIVFEGMPPPRVRFGVQAYTTDPYFTTTPGGGAGLVSDGEIDASNWTFEIPFVAGPIRLRLNGAPPTTWLKSAYVGSVNAAEFPVTILTEKDSRDDITLVVSGTAATLTGRTMGTSSQPESGALVVLFSTSRERWFTGSPWVRRFYSDVGGRFSVSPLPPGDYWVVAVDSPLDGFGHRESDWAEMLDPLTSSARRVTLNDGQTVSVNPPMASLKR